MPRKKLVKTKRNPVFEGIRAGLKESIAHIRGEIKLTEVHYQPTPQVDVKKVRAALGLSQSEFARRYGFPLRTLQDWELGRNKPLGAVRAYLLVIAKHPQMVEKVLRGQQAIKGAA